MKPVPVPLGIAGLLTLSAATFGGDPITAEIKALEAMAKLVRQDSAVLRWREIPWYTDVNEGIKAAQDEKRPLLLWITGDDPLGRC
jgi:hypothetical protein